jgi:N-acetylmuramoyl-L-alanine amidase
MVKKLKYYIGLTTIILLATSFALNKKVKIGTIKTIVIDPGHGGKDPGCNGLVHKEKDVSLAVALKLGKLIEEHYKNIKVIYTRTSDVFVELEDRAQIANRAKADLFISIHCNAAGKPVYIKDPKTGKKRKKVYKNKKGKLIVVEKPNTEPFGSETYVMGLKNEEGKMKVATRENSAIFLEDDYEKKYDGFDPDSPESYIIMSNYTSAYVIQSANLAVKIQDEYTKKAGRIDKGVHRQSIWVLWRTAMPSILTEIGYLTNPLEEQFLGSSDGQDYLAKSIFRGFRKYKDDIEGTKKEYNDDIENQTPLENENVKAGNIFGHRTKDQEEEEDEEEEVKQKKDTIKSFELKETKSVDGSKKIELVEKGNKLQDVINNVDTVESINQKVKKQDLSEDSLSAKKIVEKFKSKDTQQTTKHTSQENKAQEQIEQKKVEIIFKVQFASSNLSLNLQQDRYNKIIDGNYYKVKSVFKYTSGNFENISDAINHQNILRNNGFKDCFVIAMKNGERIDVNQAIKIVGH